MKHTSIFLKAACRRSIALLCTAVLFTASVFSAPLTADAASPALVILSRYHATLKIGDSFTLAGIASNGKWVRFKSSKSAVASVNTYGRVTAKKAGTCTITGKVAGGEASCKITVTKTIITLSTASITMENGAQVTLKGQTSNRSPISWKSQKSSVAEIDENGKISAKKPGETTITAKADGTKKTCHVTVKKPKVTLNLHLCPAIRHFFDSKSVLREKSNMEVSEKKCSHRQQPRKSHGNKTWHNKNPGID